MPSVARFLLKPGVACTAMLALLAACGPAYSPDTYASSAMQQASKVEQGVIAGVRPVGVSAAGTVGAVTGAAAGGVAGSQVGVGPASAFTAIGGSLVGGLVGSAAEHATADTKAFEYIIRKPNGDLISVTQRDEVPLALGQKVLVIAGIQARVVPDYTMHEADRPAPKPVAQSPAPAAVPLTTAPPPGAAPDAATPPPGAPMSSVPTTSGLPAAMPDDPAKHEATP